MALYELEGGYVWDDETTDVMTPDGTLVGWLDEEGFEPLDAEPTGGPSVREAVQAGWYEGREEARSDLNALREEFRDAQEALAVSAGYALAREDSEAEERIADEDEEDFETALEALEARLGRPLSVTDSEMIANHLPEGDYGDDDLDQIAKRIGLSAFTGDPDDPGSRSRAAENRTAYIDARSREMEDAADESYRSGEYDPVEDGGGLFGQLMHDERTERLAQSTSTSGLN